MENKINIAELLKDCPSGMELDCTIYDDVTLYKIFDSPENEYPIRIETKNGYFLDLTKYGTYTDIDEAKCVIFPKGKTTWEGFNRPFEDGDVVVAEDSESFQLFLLKHLTHSEYDNSYDGYCYFGWDFQCNDLFEKGNWGFNRLATEEEKSKLFDAIKKHGYKWNEETKTLEKLIEPHTPEKFYIRIGDIPSEEKSAVYRGEIVVGYEDGVSVYDCVETDGLYRIVMPFPLKEGQGMTYEFLIQDITQCRYKIDNPRNVYLVSGIEVGKGHDNEPLIKEVKILKDLTGQFNTKTDNTEETKTLEKLPKFKVGDTITKIDGSRKGKILYIDVDRYHVAISNNIGIDVFFEDQNDWKLIPNKFNITILKPFESKVLVRDYVNRMWRPAFWDKYIEDSNCSYLTTNGCYKQCIPYEGNEHLLWTTDDCDEFYKNW